MSAPALSLMVVPNPADMDAMPLILVDHGGVWRDMSTTGLKASDVIGKVNENLSGLSQLIGKEEITAGHLVIRNIFSDIYRLIVPPKVQEMVEKTARAAGPGETPLLRVHTHTSNEWIPWEAFHDGTGLLGLRFQIARLPIVPHILDASDTQPRRVRNVYSFLGKEVLNDDNQRQEWEQTFDGLAVTTHLFPPAGDQSDFPDLQRVSQNYESADILHVTCHGMKDARENVYLTLNHRSTAAAAILYNITSGALNGFVFNTRPLVFGNGCSSAGAAAGAAGDANPAAGGLMPPALGASFFSRGAMNFVGTFAPVSKSMALQFARKFYEHLLGAGQPALPVGQALWATKKHFFDAKSTDPSYLFYCLYGPPEAAYEQ